MNNLINEVLEQIRTYCTEYGYDETEALILVGHALVTEAEIASEKERLNR